MANTTFVDGSTVITADWLNDVNRKTYNEIVSVKDFGAKGDSTTDDTAAIAAAWAASKYLLFPAGNYKVSALPNFAVNGARIETFGCVIIQYTGTSDGLVIDAGSTAGIVNYNISIGPMTIIGNSSARYGVYIRGITHSSFSRLRPINFPQAAMRCEFMVSNKFDDFCYSGNEAGVTVATINGIVFEKRGTGEQCSDCTLTNPIIEGTTGDGIVLNEAAVNTFICGTSEGNGTGGGAGAVFVGPNSFSNTFINLDMEFNGKASDSTSYHVKNYGLRTKFINPFCDNNISDLFWVAGGNSLMIEGGQLCSLKIDAAAKNTITFGMAYSGTITDNGTSTRRIQEYNINSAITTADSEFNFTTWSPTVSGITSTTSYTIQAAYQKINKMVYFSIYLEATGGGTLTGSSASFTVPVSQNANYPGAVNVIDNGDAQGIGSAAIFSNTIYSPNYSGKLAVIYSGSYFSAV